MPARRPPDRRSKPTHHRIRPRLLLLFLTSPLLLALASLHLSAATLRHANALGRRCSPDHSPSLVLRRQRIAMVSFSWEIAREGSSRSFAGLEAAVGGTKRAYASRMGYDLIDGRNLVDPARPPSWSKILAVRSCLPAYDWVFWNDADTVVTNPDIRLENILWSVIGHDDFDASPDLIFTEDINGVNAGVFFVRRSKWSEDFLCKWWNQTSFVSFGTTKSGDNAALKHLIDCMVPKELQEHIRISSKQCLFNSYPWFPSLKSAYRLISSPRAAWKGSYSKGDFMVHLAGIDEKKEWAAQILQEMEAGN